MGSLPVNPGVSAVVVDPRDPKIVFIAGTAGVFRSSDGGLNWEPRRQGLGSVDVAALALNPNHPDTLFVATAGGSFFRSDDAAQNWKPVTTTSSPQ